MSITEAALPRPPRSPYPGNPQDMERWTRELRDYLDRVYKALVQAATDVSGAQPLSPKLTALAALNGTGLIEKTGAATYAMRAIGDDTAASILSRADADARYVQEVDAENYVAGPNTATDNAVARFDAATGKLVQNSAVTIDDNGVLAGFRIGTHSALGAEVLSGYITITDAGGTSRKLGVIS